MFFQKLVCFCFSCGILFGCAKKSLEPMEPETAYRKEFFNRKRDYWPTVDWRIKKPVEVGLDEAKLKELERYCFTRTGDEQNRAGIRTDGLLIIRNGYLVYEEYARGYTKDKKHHIWSDTKSVLNAAIGVAIREGKLQLEDSAGKYLQELSTEDKKNIKIKDLLEMSSGLFWDEGYESSPLKSLVIAMLYTRGRIDMGRFAAQQRVQYPPGERFYYSSGTSNILSLILRKALGEERYATFFWDEIYKPLGMKNVTMERDMSGTFVASSYMFLPPRELAKFGFLYLNDGVWEKKRILPEGWVQYTVTMAKAYYTTPMDTHLAKDNPGAHWWLNLGIKERGQERPWPKAPRDTFAAEGHWGQFLFVIPSLDMVVVRTGDDRDGSFDLNTFLGLVVESVKEKVEL